MILRVDMRQALKKEFVGNLVLPFDIFEPESKGKQGVVQALQVVVFLVTANKITPHEGR